MKKNVLLYVLLVFLIVVNGLFLFNYLGNSDDTENKDRSKGPISFIVKELDFNDEQMLQLEKINRKHHHRMMRIGDDIKQLKDALFNKLSDVSFNENSIDSITTLIGKRVKEQDIEAFYHFKDIQELCNDQQKEKFKSIINDALHKRGRKEQRPHLRNGEGERRLPPPRH
ncbi:Spy/CpxP family protein refolding chaperone [Flavivirga rizhaonensis]|uniref:Periplasmic heavy metal sensor n=1 Tax=Flavivirga rizhaonensis TaxID=2559571 RepID=A0A4S1DXL7_9FLAO|nr:hypothetical protein [Flavivirga rizhaonensis]TGV02685.1 hypothetical protein EM932_09625 [Flavivirga rizhaonensis]